MTAAEVRSKGMSQSFDQVEMIKVSAKAAMRRICKIMKVEKSIDEDDC